MREQKKEIIVLRTNLPSTKVWQLQPAANKPAFDYGGASMTNQPQQKLPPAPLNPAMQGLVKQLARLAFNKQQKEINK